jgi:hypothetical protein
MGPGVAAMLSEENSEGGLLLSSPHETPDAAPSALLLSESQSLRYAERVSLWEAYEKLAAQGLSQVDAARQLSVSNTKLSRMAKAVAAYGLDGLKDKYHNCGRDSKITLTEAELQTLAALYLKTNRTKDDGSMQAACKVFALDPQTREEVRTGILSALEKGRLPRWAIRACKRITREHFAAKRNPSSLASNHFSGRRGAFASDKRERRRAVESDDGTLNFVATIPWPHGGDPCSDKYGVKLGRWQFLPALEAGWSNFYLGYALVARPQSVYTQEDIRAMIKMVVKAHGLPDAFRFERGTWESNSVVDLLKRLGVDLQTVWQSNQKPYVEGGFSPLWTYLSLIDGQVGRFRGEMEKENLLIEKVRAGRLDPRGVFPDLQRCTKALDGALAMRNSDRISSPIYGAWIPEVRYRDHKAERPWRAMPAELEYLFAPLVKEWTVAKGTVGNAVTLADGIKAPFYFSHDDLWRMNGEKVRVYFDPAGESATIVSLTNHAGFVPGDIVCEAALLGEIPHFTRAAMGWADPVDPSAIRPPSNRKPMSAIRREVRALDSGGKVKATFSEERDGNGRVARAERISNPPRNTSAAPALAPDPRGQTPIVAAPRRQAITEPEEIETIEELSDSRSADAAPEIEVERIDW